MHFLIKQSLQQLQQILLPTPCLLCLANTQLIAPGICCYCIDHLIQSKPCCEICAHPLSQPGICGQCLKKPPYFDQTHCLGFYRDHLRHLLVQLKFHEKLVVSHTLGKLMAKKLSTTQETESFRILPLSSSRKLLAVDEFASRSASFIRDPGEVDRRGACPWIPRSSRGMTGKRHRGMTGKGHRRMTGKEHRRMTKLRCRGVKKSNLPDCIIPVPLSKNRLRQRGFNQALELAKVISHTLNIPFHRHHCIRQRSTLPQTALPANKRPSNVRNAFTLTKPLLEKHIAIVDDVMTTGSTANELARLLKKHGAYSIQVWCIARTVR